MIWRGTSLRYGTGKKKANEVDFISQGMKLALDGLVCESRIVEVKEIVSRLLEEVEKLEWWFEQDIGDEEEEEDEEGEGGSEV
ncbi:hypothetical protein Tco_0077194 [Tanacetum coccineum]